MIKATVTGIPDLKAALAGIVPKLRVRALRLALAAGARVVQKAARGATPVINASAMAVRKGYRKPGTVRDAISVRTSKTARAAGNVGVFVNVRPAKGAKYRTRTANVLGFKVRSRTLTRASQRGAKSPNDPYYWRWINFGWNSAGGQTGGRDTAAGKSYRRFLTKKVGTTMNRGAHFLEAGAAALPAALTVFMAKIGPAIEKLNRPKAPAP